MHWFKHNWRLKLIALFLASLVWFFVNGITNDRRLVQAVPLEIQTASGVTLLQQNPLMVDVTVRGTRSDMHQVSRDDLSVVLDLTGYDGSGESSHRLSPGAVRHPRWAQPVDINPSRVMVVIDKIIEQDILIAPQIRGRTARGYQVGDVLINPTVVRVVGPALRVEKLASIPTAPIVVSGRSRSFSQHVELNADGLADLSLQRRSVDVDVEILEVTGEQDDE